MSRIIDNINIDNVKKNIASNIASYGDMTGSVLYHKDDWDYASVVNDFLNIAIGNQIIHLKSIEYNFAKFVNDSLDEDKSFKDVSADVFNLSSATLIFAADCTPIGRLRGISLNVLGNVVGMIGNSINFVNFDALFDSLQPSLNADDNVYIVLNLPDCQQFTMSVPRDELIELGIMDKDGHYINGGISGIYNLGDGINGSDGASSSDVNDGNLGGNDNPGDGYNPKFPKDGTPLNKIPPAGDPVVLNLSEESK